MIYLFCVLLTFYLGVKYPRLYDEDHLSTELLILLSLIWPVTLSIIICIWLVKLAKFSFNKLVYILEKIRCYI